MPTPSPDQNDNIRSTIATIVTAANPDAENPDGEADSPSTASRQHDPKATSHPTGEQQAQENAANESPA